MFKRTGVDRNIRNALVDWEEVDPEVAALDEELQYLVNGLRHILEEVAAQEE
jgi:hypothetical protein